MMTERNYGMKRIFVLFLSFVICLMYILPSAAEEVPARQYNFDLFFHLDCDALPSSIQERARGYSDLLDIIELRGSAVYSLVNQSRKYDFSVIPVTNRDASVSFSLYGLPSHMVMNSSLLGEETVLFNNAALMEFAQKTYSHLGLPLPYLALAYPYCATNAFSTVVKSWKKRIGTFTDSTTVSLSDFTVLGRVWSKNIEEDTALRDWLSALSLESDHSETLDAEINGIPAYLRNCLAAKGDVRVEIDHDAGTEVWSNDNGQFYYLRSVPSSYSVVADLPVTENGYKPYLNYQQEDSPEEIHMSLDLSYSPDESALSEGRLDPRDLLSIKCSAVLPNTWPVSGEYTAEAEVTGLLLPAFTVKAVLTAAESGDMQLSIRIPSDGGSEKEIFTVTGAITSCTPEEAPKYSAAKLSRNFNIFSVNDVTLPEFVRSVAGPCFRGVLNFLVEVPASSCQSIMDDLSDFGVLSVVLGE